MRELAWHDLSWCLRRSPWQVLSLLEKWQGEVFVGGGYAGLEGIAEMQDFAVAALKRYPRCREVGMRWVLIDVAARIMPEIQPQLAAFTQRIA